VTDRQLPDWTPDLFRVVVVGLTLPPAVGKVVSYGGSVRFFTALGIPAPRLAVAVVAVVEVGAVVLLAVDRWRWAAALPLLPTMAVAYWTTGEWQAVAVFLAALGLLAVDAGIVAVAAEGTGGTGAALDGGPESASDDGSARGTDGESEPTTDPD
jgi:uncharacterized membrane protein YphA (DoxX/SURF4 family)